MKSGVNDLNKKMKQNQTDKKPVGTANPPEIEVVARAHRRRFTVGYKLRILQEVDNAGSGEVGKILRREGLYSSHLAKWRQQRREGKLVPRKRGPKPKMDDQARKKLARLERENARLNRRLNQAEKIIDIQKKISDLLGIPLEETPTEEN
jgi:transposase-like protein